MIDQNKTISKFREINSGFVVSGLGVGSDEEIQMNKTKIS